MKLMILYGPPAVGKLTVAKALANITGYKLFHNHLTVDVVTSIFTHGSPAYFSLIQKMRRLVLTEAARANIPGLIQTFVYGPARMPALEFYEGVVHSNGGHVCYVRLYCDRGVLLERVTSEDRKNYGKIAEIEHLNRVLTELREPFASVEGRESLHLDLGELTAESAAQAIQTHYKLPNVVIKEC